MRVRVSLCLSLSHLCHSLFCIQFMYRWWQRCIQGGENAYVRCLIFIGHFPQNSPIISGSFEGRNKSGYCRVVRMHRMPYFCRSFSAKQPYNTLCVCVCVCVCISLSLSPVSFIIEYSIHVYNVAEIHT